MLLDQQWFSEIDQPTGTAFSLRIKQKLHEEHSEFQKITVYETTDFGRMMALDDVIMVTDRDNFIYHEMLVHSALFIHPNPREIAIIGGGDCGSLREVLKHHSVTQVTQIEIDERVTRVSEQYFPALCESNTDPRAKFLFTDGIRWMQETADHSLDIILIDSTDPVGMAEGLFNTAFYSECRRVLRPNGILAQQTESPLLHTQILQKAHHSLRAAGFAQVRTLHFPQCVYQSGWWSATLASAESLATMRYQDCVEKQFTTHYYHADLHAASFVLPQFIQTALNT
jgi:spermidine synthase